MGFTKSDPYYPLSDHVASIVRYKKIVYGQFISTIGKKTNQFIIPSNFPQNKDVIFTASSVRKRARDEKRRKTTPQS